MENYQHSFFSMSYFNEKITERIKFTFLFSLSTSIVIHLYMLLNNWKNHDSLWHFYGDMNLSSSGRFTLKYLGGLSSYFDLHYFNLLIACVFLSLGFMYIVEIFNLTNKYIIGTFSILYCAFPSVSGTFSYAFTADAYYLSYLLTIFSIFICNRGKFNFIFSSVLMYIALGTYQANLTLAVTLLILILIQDLITNNLKTLKEYLIYLATVVLGLIMYVIHFKLFQLFSEEGLTNYTGINEAGNISIESLKTSFNNALLSFNSFVFNNYNFQYLFEKLNAVYILLVLLLLILLVARAKLKLNRFFIIIFLIGLAPYYLYLIYFVSPNVYYHILMKQSMPLMFLIGIFIIQALNSKAIKKTMLILFTVIGFNFIIITNIYYEKLALINNYTDSLMTKVSYRIETLDENQSVDSILVIGNPNNTLKIIENFNTNVPYNVGVINLIFNSYTTTVYLNNYLGHQLTALDENSTFYKDHYEDIIRLSTWPSKDSVKIIDKTVIVKFE